MRLRVDPRYPRADPGMVSYFFSVVSFRETDIFVNDILSRIGLRAEGPMGMIFLIAIFTCFSV